MLCPVGISPATPKPPAPARAPAPSPSFLPGCGFCSRILVSMASSVPVTKNENFRSAPTPARESLVISSPPSVPLLGAIGGPTIRPSPELGLLSLLFVLSMAVGSVLSLAIVSVPSINAFRKMGNSMSEMSKVAAKEVPWTLFSLKLSGLEVGELTQHLRNLRQRISGIHGTREKGSKSSAFGRKRRNSPSRRPK